MTQGKTNVVGAAAGLGAAAVLAACFVSADHKRGLTCDEAAERGYICEPTAGAAGGGGSVSGMAGAPVMGAGGASGLGGGGAGGGGAGGGGSAGGGLACNAPEVDCGGTCVDVTASDAANCGACGYACGAGSTCTAGACSPVAIVSGVVAPYAFALDAESLYFVVPVKDERVVPPAVPPAVQKVPRAGGSPTPVFSGSIFRSRSLALVDGTLFFGDLDTNGVLRKGPLDGSSVAVHLTNQPAVQHLVEVNGRLWWSTFDGTSRLRRASATGTPAIVEELLPGPSFVQFGRVPTLAVEGTAAAETAFWVNAGGSVPTDQGLWRKTGTDAPVKLVPDGSMVTLALGNGVVYVADAAAGIGKVASNAPAPAALTPVVPAPQTGGAVHGLTVSGDTLYWLTFNAGQLEVHRSGLDGTEARVLGRVAAKSAAYWGAPLGPVQLTVDGGFVYFSDPGTLTGNTSASNETLEGVTGAADGAVYRLPQ